MSGSTNIKQWNPEAANQETDGAYEADTLRSGGAVSGICPSTTFNKFAYQVTTIAKALAQAMANKGFTMNDSDLAGMIANFADLMLTTDLPAFFPSQQTPNGYQKLASGLIVQWAQSDFYTVRNGGRQEITVTFPEPFPNNLLFILPGTVWASVAGNAFLTATVDLASSTLTQAVMWLVCQANPGTGYGAANLLAIGN